MSRRAIKAALCIGLMSVGVAATEKPTSDLVKVKVKALDSKGHSINDLQQGDFALKVDNANTEINWWMKEQGLFHRSTYTLGFKANRRNPANRHVIEVRVKPPNAQLRYPPSLEY